MARVKRKRNYGSGSVLQYGIGGSKWRIAARLADGQRIQRRGFESKELAEAALVHLTSPSQNGPRAHAAPKLAVLATSWLQKRKVTHRSGDEDRKRWNKHLAPVFGDLRPDDLTADQIKKLVEAKLATGLSPGTCKLLVRELSTFYTDLVDDGWATRNPAKGLPRKTKALIRSNHDPKDTPFIQSLPDVVRIFERLEKPYSIAYAIGAFGGLRTGEIRALQWLAVDLKARLIYVRHTVRNGELGPTKDHETRAIPIMDVLHPVLTAWHEETKGGGMVCPRIGPRGKFLDERAMNAKLRAVLQRQDMNLHQPGLGWYEATRHTFASHYVMEGGTLENLKGILGHSTILVTERYAHLLPSRYQADRARFAAVQLAPDWLQKRETRPKSAVK